SKLGRRHGERAAAEEGIVYSHARTPEQRTIGLVQRLGARDLVDEPQLQMVLQIFADAGLVEHDRDAEALELIGAADTGELEDLHRADRAGGQNHLAAIARGSACTVLPPAHSSRARAVELDPLDQAIELDAQIGALEHRFEKGARRRPPPPAPLIDVEGAA